MEHDGGTWYRPEDETLVADLGRVLAEADPVPEWVYRAAREAITTRTLDEELAVLIGDTSSGPGDVPDPELAGTGALFESVRTAAAIMPEGRILSFAGGDVQIDLEIDRRGGTAHLIGQLTGASPGDCSLEYGTGQRRLVVVDDLGRFLVPVVNRGPVRLRCRSHTGTRVATAWIAL